MVYCLVVWNIFPYVGNVIIPTDFKPMIFQGGRSITNIYWDYKWDHPLSIKLPSLIHGWGRRCAPRLGRFLRVPIAANGEAMDHSYIHAKLSNFLLIWSLERYVYTYIYIYIYIHIIYMYIYIYIPAPDTSFLTSYWMLLIYNVVYRLASKDCLHVFGHPFPGLWNDDLVLFGMDWNYQLGLAQEWGIAPKSRFNGNVIILDNPLEKNIPMFR